MCGDKCEVLHLWHYTLVYNFAFTMMMNYLHDLSLKCSRVVITEVAS